MPDVPFPEPDLVVGGRRLWKNRTQRCWEHKQKGLPGEPEPKPDDDQYRTAKQVRKSLGDVSSMWLHRHMRRGTDEAAA